LFDCPSLAELHVAFAAEVDAQHSMLPSTASATPHNYHCTVITLQWRCLLCRRRLFDCPSLADLDAAFAAEVAAVHSANLLQLSQPDEQTAAARQQQWQQHQQQLSQTCVWNIMMRVRA
jgi:hypothetical protein